MRFFEKSHEAECFAKAGPELKSLRNLCALGVSAVSISWSIHRGAAEIAEADAEKLEPATLLLPGFQSICHGDMLMSLTV